ncbi:MAG: hypothetical protein AAB923_01075 [Patescibacteria group bacterium]
MMGNILTRVRSFFASFTRPYPARDWFIVLIAVIAVFLGSVLFAGYLLYGIRSGGIIDALVPEAPPQPSITKTSITEIVEMYRARRVNFEAHNLPILPLKDPR